MARIAYVAYHNSTLRPYMRMTGVVFTYNSGRQRFLEATNKLIQRSPIFTGMKTGYTDLSGRCLVSSASENGHDVILVQLGGTHNVLFNDAERVLVWGLQRDGAGGSELARLAAGQH
jgi:D-alanyl-D-alanine carboxypeptidase